MRQIITLTTLIFLIFSPAVSAAFPDTDRSFYRDAIDTLSSEGMISGFPDGTFGSEKTITRAEILKIFLNTKKINLTESPKTRCFRDVDITLWYHPYICGAVKLGIVQGFDDGSFGPDIPVTTLEALTMGLRLYGFTPPSTTPWYQGYQEFADANTILKTSNYSLVTPMSRGKASELILQIRTYADKKIPLQNLSRGCNTGGHLSGINTVKIADKDRSYILSIPSGYSTGKPVSLIVAIHGRTNSNAVTQGYMGLEGGQSDSIVAYPAGIDTGRGSRSWSSEENITLFDTIVRDIGDNYCIDRSRVFVVAHSLGAWFASKLACVRGDVIRGIGIVGGGGWTSSCNNTPTAALIYQNANDALSSPATARSTEKVMKNTNTCGATTEPVTIGSLTCQKWKDCSSGNPVIWCEGYSTYGNDPHSWPIGGGSSILSFLRGLR